MLTACAANSLTHKRGEPWITMKRFEIDIDADTSGGESGQTLCDPLERFERTFAIAAKRVDVGDVISGERIIGAAGDA